MPYRITQSHPKCSGYAVVKKDGGKLMGCHKTKPKAQAQLTALNLDEGGPGYKADAVFGPSGRIILQDLNVALSSNFSELSKNRPMSKFVQEVEEYRSWMIELLKHEYVILVTARSIMYEDMTLERIKSQTGWMPNDWCFNPWVEDEKAAMRPHRAKARYLKEIIMPRYGNDPSLYFAIESNKFSRSMYKANDIECRDANRDDSQPWKSLLP